MPQSVQRGDADTSDIGLCAAQRPVLAGCAQAMPAGIARLAATRMMRRKFMPRPAPYCSRTPAFASENRE
jgi:hypothetical protein